MLACIPTNGNAGPEDTVCEHFGSAPYFTLYDSNTGELKVLENRNAHQSHGTCHPMNQLARQHIDCVVCSGMGRRAIEALSTEGIRVYASESGRVSDLVEEIKAGKLTAIDPARACRGQGQRAGLAPGAFDPGEGRGAGFGRGGCHGQNRRGGGDRRSGRD